MSSNNPFLGRRFFGQFGSICALCTMLASPAVGQSGESGAAPADPVSATDYGVVDISIQDTDLADVLQMLGMQTEKNIIVSKNVSATVTAYLYDVTLHEALNAILKPNGYGFREEGNFIYVHTQEELNDIDARNRKVEHRIFELEHLSAADAHEFIKGMLSEKGVAAYRGDVPKGIDPEITDVGADDWAFGAKLLVTDYPENLEAIAAALAELDGKPKQVLVESTILQTTLDEENAFGIDFTILGSLDFANLTAPLDAVTNLLNGRDPTSGIDPFPTKAHAVTSNIGNTPGAGGLKIGIVRDDISVFLRVLDEVTDTIVLARPKVMALNRQRAEVHVGARVGYLSSTATETSTTQSVKFLDTGIKLVFRPFISPDGSIRMELAPSVSEASLRTVTDANGLIVTIPDELTNELTTNIRVRDGQTLVLGGLFRESTRVTRRQIPILGDIPIIGLPFRGQDDKVDRDEIIFLITPTIVHEELLTKIGMDAMDLAESARVGMRAGLLPFSRDKMTNNYNQDAIEALHEGKPELALFHINNSLRTNPSQPEMIQLRDEITGAAPSRLHEMSVLQRAVAGNLMEEAMNGGGATGEQPSAATAASDAPATGTPPAAESAAAPQQMTANAPGAAVSPTGTQPPTRVSPSGHITRPNPLAAVIEVVEPVGQANKSTSPQVHKSTGQQINRSTGPQAAIPGHNEPRTTSHEQPTTQHSALSTQHSESATPDNDAEMWGEWPWPFPVEDARTSQQVNKSTSAPHDSRLRTQTFMAGQGVPAVNADPATAQPHDAKPPASAQTSAKPKTARATPKFAAPTTSPYAALGLPEFSNDPDNFDQVLRRIFFQVRTGQVSPIVAKPAPAKSKVIWSFPDCDDEPIDVVEGSSDEPEHK